jgi:hypothetical protein
MTSMHSHAGSLCTAPDRLAAALLAHVRNTTSGSCVEANPYYLGYPHVATHQRKPHLPFFLSPRVHSHAVPLCTASLGGFDGRC